jgi:hypothetical protein
VWKTPPARSGFSITQWCVTGDDTSSESSPVDIPSPRARRRRIARTRYGRSTTRSGRTSPPFVFGTVDPD